MVEIVLSLGVGLGAGWVLCYFLGVKPLIQEIVYLKKDHYIPMYKPAELAVKPAPEAWELVEEYE